MTTDSRIAELTANLHAVRRRIESACEAAGRSSADVALVAVSKTWPASDVLALRSLGVRDFGESYDQEAKSKASALTAMQADVRWHFVGRMQRNKCASIASYADMVQSVDRPEVVDALAAGARRSDRSIDVLIQISLDGDTSRGGAPLDSLAQLADSVAAAAPLQLRGVMAVAPLGMPAERAFSALAGAAAGVRAGHPQADVISAGMTSDLEAAIATGSTCVRVGSALFGRPAHALD